MPLERLFGLHSVIISDEGEAFARANLRSGAMSPSAASQPMVSVVLRIPQASDRALQTIQSLLRQTLEAWDLALVGPGAQQVLDGASGLDPRIRRALVIAATGNQAAPLNRAAASTRSPFVAFADSGDVASINRLALQWRFLQNGQEYGLVAAGADYPTPRRGAGRQTVLQVTPDGLLALLLHENVIPFGTVMVRREYFHGVGGFDEHLQQGGEHDLWLRLALRYRPALLPEVLCRHVTRDRGSRRAREETGSCPDDHRRRHVEHLLQVHPRGARILEDAVSQYPLDDVLWKCYLAGPGAASRLFAEPPDRPTPRPSATLRDPGPERQPRGVAVEAMSGSTEPPADRGLSALFVACLLAGAVDPAPFNDLGRHYAQRNPLLAYLCRLRALSIEPNQGSVLTQALAAWSDGVTKPRVSPMERLDATRAVLAARQGAPTGACTVSVLMPTYNRAHRIRESIQSVLNQTFQDFELVVVDDGSVDATEDAVRALATPRVHYIRTPHRGLAAALNAALQHAQGRYVAYLDDDDIYYPHHLSRLVSVLETSDAAMVYSKSRLLYGRYDGATFRPVLDLGTHTAPYNYDSLHQYCIISTLNVLHRRDCLAALSGFDERLSRCMDWDFWVRLSERFPIVHVDAFTGEYRYHEGNMNVQNFAEGRVLNDLLQNYFTSCRGAAILYMAAHAQDRLKECEPVQRALERIPFAFREDLYRRLVEILPRVPGGFRLVERLFSARPHWYLRYMVSLCREHRWGAFRDIPAAFYPRVLRSGASRCWPFVARHCAEWVSGLRGDV